VTRPTAGYAIEHRKFGLLAQGLDMGLYVTNGPTLFPTKRAAIVGRSRGWLVRKALGVKGESIRDYRLIRLTKHFGPKGEKE
jgi:hypothetical protein